MSRDWFADVLAFHEKFRPHLIGATPACPDAATGEFRHRLINEEIDETGTAMASGDLPGIADGIADAIYVLLGAAVTYGIYLPDIWDAVHSSNMRKILSPSRPDGKVLKGPGWTPPDVAGILARQGPLPRGDVSTESESWDRIEDILASRLAYCEKNSPAGWLPKAHADIAAFRELRRSAERMGSDR